jgi:hypothetical protein
VRIAWIAVPFAVFAAVSPAFADEGLVVDRSNGQPIPGAVVVRVWQGSVPMPVQSSLQCYHLAAAVADGQGRFSLSSYSFTFKPFLQGRRDYIATAYKPGYRFVSALDPARVLMEPLSDDRAKRLRQIASMRIPLDCPFEDVKILIEPILRPAYRESMALARTEEEWQQADDLLATAEWLELGLNVAHANAVVRRAHWRDTIVQDQGKGAGR